MYTVLSKEQVNKNKGLLNTRLPYTPKHISRGLNLLMHLGTPSWSTPHAAVVGQSLSPFGHSP